jgi:hypothetical protein
MCGKHAGKEIINIVVNLSVNYIFECLFGYSDFNKKYWSARKFDNMRISEWAKKDSIESRTMEYNISISALGKVNNIDEQVSSIFINIYIYFEKINGIFYIKIENLKEHIK